MDAIEFAKTVRKICCSHPNCVECEFARVPGKCDLTSAYANHEVMVSVADRWVKERRREVTLAELTTIKSDRDKLAARFAAANEKINALIAFAEAISYGFEPGCEASRETVRENYELAQELIEEYNAALDEIERRGKMETNARMEQMEKRIAWLEKLKAEDERAILILHEQNENLQRQIEEIKERLGRPDAKREAGVKAERTRQDVMKEITSGILWDGEGAHRCCPKLVDPAVVCRGDADKCQECRREYWMAGIETKDRRAERTPPKEETKTDEKTENEPSAPEFLCAAAMKKVLQDEPVLRVIASLTLGPDYEKKMEMAREAVERRRMGKDGNKDGLRCMEKDGKGRKD